MKPISATGEDGFTLTEILVVMVIVGLLTTAVLLAGPVIRVTLGDEAERFAALLTRARDEAVLMNRTIEVRVWPKGYEFEVARPGGRTKLTTEPFGMHPWSEDTTVLMTATDGRTRIAFDATGMASPAVVELMRREARIRVNVTAAGEISIDVQ